MKTREMNLFLQVRKPLERPGVFDPSGLVSFDFDDLPWITQCSIRDCPGKARALVAFISDTLTEQGLDRQQHKDEPRSLDESYAQAVERRLTEWKNHGTEQEGRDSV